MKKSLITVLLLVVLASVDIGFAQVQTWNVDKEHSNIFFSADHIYSKVRGQFDNFNADIKFDPQNLAESSFYFEIEVNSINTNLSKRDKHLLSADFFAEADYPLIRFRSNAISAVGNNVYTVTGKLTIKGKEYDLAFPLSFAGTIPHPFVKGAQSAGFNGEFQIDRLSYGVGTGKFHDMGVVGKDIDLLVSLEVLHK